jgi:anti-sigma factor RsiW
MTDDELRSLVQQGATRHRASESLRAAVRTQIALDAARDGSPRGGSQAWFPSPSLRAWWGRWRVAGSGFAAGAALTWTVFAALPWVSAGSEAAEERVAAHVRALQFGPVLDVASDDRHNVKPWYQGRLDYAPPVPDLSADGYTLLGGRLDRLAGAPVATLAYRSRLHVLSVTVAPAGGERLPHRVQRRGFNTLHWTEGGMQVWVVSDQDAAEIERFGQAWRRQARPATP